MANDKDNPLIVVTGGAGLIGSAIVWQLNQLGIHQIIIVDHLGESDKWKNLRALKYLDYYEKDAFINQITCNKLPYPIQSIFHMGACSATTEKDASYLVQNNFEYTRDLAMYALKRGIRFIYASSAATYGDGTLGYADSEDKIELLRPLNMYGYSKQMFDLWAKNHGLFAKITGLKFFQCFWSQRMA
jgi:ADP-L-glycero-D-manno-heptose 6-epimerase